MVNLTSTPARARRGFESWLGRMSKRRSRQGLYEFLEREYTSIDPGADVLSIGAGGEINTLLDRIAVQTGFKVTTFDIDVARGPDLVGDICTYDFRERNFDAVVISEVLEHLTAPALGLRTVHRALKPGGRLILSTPFALPLHDRPHDYFRFTRYGLELLLRDFRHVTVHERNSYFEAIDVLWLRLLAEKSDSARLSCYLLVPFIFYLKRPLTVLLDRLVRTDGLTTGYVATGIK
jgi:2-polyprenyl-3-methyl-5-hydroxy-6-metoxy-1,4-benzoquinol methylase